MEGRPEAEARATLTALGFTVRETDEYSTTTARGKVIRSDPAPGQSAPKGSEVSIVVSLGPKTFDMPNVVEMTGEEARTTLEALGLEVTIVPLPSVDPPDTVVFQEPAAGTTVEEGQEVTIYVTGS